MQRPRKHHARRVVMGRLWTFVAAVFSAVVLLPSPANGAAYVKINHWGSGATAAYDKCTPQANGDSLCEDYIVSYYWSLGSTRDGVARDQAGLALEHYEAFVHPDGTYDEFVAEIGFASEVFGTSDNARLTFARTTGATLDLNNIDPNTGNLVPNGRTATVGPFAWTAASGIYAFGNDGPFGFGLPRHYVDRCLTQIENAHERFTTAHVTGTINGVSVDALGGSSYLPFPGTGPADALGAIFDNRFTVLFTGHAPSC